MKTLKEKQKILLSYYSPTKPVTSPEGLKGRERELKEALYFLLNEDGIIVQGARRIGKTSFLHCLDVLCSQQGRHCIYISFQRISKYDRSTFVNHLIDQISSYIEIPRDYSSKDAELFGALKRLGKLIDEKYKPDKRFIVFLDEFQLTEEFSEEERRIFYNQLRNVIEERANHLELGRFVFVISTSQSLSELSIGISSTLASSFPRTFTLSRISSQDSHELIRHPLAEFIKVEDEIVDFIAYESGGHPYLIKVLLHDIIIKIAADFPSSTDAYSFRELAENQVTELAENLEHDHFVMLKNILSEVELQILYEIDKHQKRGFLDIREAIFSFFEKFNRSARASSVRSSVDNLMNLQILQKSNELFSYANGIYQKWFSLFFERYYVNEAIQKFRKIKPDYAILELKTIFTPGEFFQIIHDAILYLKKVFEEKGLWELAWKDKSNGISHHERYLQKMTAALLDRYLAPYNIMIEREVESGVGPMDIKLMLNRKLTACLEIKKSTGNVYHGLEVEMKAYIGSTIKIGFFILFYIGGGTTLKTMMNKLNSIVKKIGNNQSNKLFKVICIDCIPKKSASKQPKVRSNKR